MKDKAKTILRIVVSVVLIAASGYYALKDVNFSELMRIVSNVSYFWIFASVPVILLSHWVRAMRWKTMLEPALKKKSASTWNLFSAVMIGYAGNCVLPRGGEFIRPFVYSRREKVSFSTSFATIIVERFIDLITMIFLFGVIFLFLSHKILKALPDIEPHKIIVPTVIVLGVMIVSFYPPVFRFMIRLFIKPFSLKLFDKLSQLFEKFLKGFAIIKTPSQYFRVTVESLVIWFLYTIPLYFMFFSFDFHLSYSLNFSDALILIIVAGVSATIAPTPGAIGIQHVMMQVAMVNIYGISKEAALAYATVTHAVNYFIQLSVGGVFFMRENIKGIPSKVDYTSELNTESAP
ncbi:MAG: lysylphosphatidylglycerol synthase transmembrane domain-containing protein [Bacteroidota bacterium]|jgi:hypothetical protein